MRHTARTLAEAADPDTASFMLGDAFRPHFAEAQSAEPASLVAEGALLTDLEQILSSSERGPVHLVETSDGGPRR